MTHAGESPVGVVGAVIVFGGRGQGADDAGRGGELDLKVAAIRMVDINRQLDVFDAHCGAGAEVKRDGDGRSGIGNGLGRRGGRGQHRLRSEGNPCVGEVGGCLGVDEAAAVVSVLFDQGQAGLAAIAGDPIGIGGLDFRGGTQEDFLYVAPAEGGVPFEDQGDDAGNDGGGGRRAREGFRVVGVSQLALGEARVVALVSDEVGGDDSDFGVARGADHEVSAAFAEIGRRGLVGDGTHRDDMQVRRVGVFTALVAVRLAVARGPDVDRAQSAAARGRVGGDSAQPEGAGFAQNPRSVVGRTPAVALDLDDIAFPIHRLGVVLIGLGERDQAQAVKGGPGSRAHHADAVVAGGGETGATSAVPILGHVGRGIGVVAIPVVIAGGGDIGDQIGVADLQAVIHESDGDAGAIEGRPDGCDIDVDTGGALLLAGVFQVPLLGEQRVSGSGQGALGTLAGEERNGGGDVGEL